MKGEYQKLKNTTDSINSQHYNLGFLFSKGNRFHDAAGLNRDWPHNRGTFINENENLVIWINQEDHLRIASYSTNMKQIRIQEVYKRLTLALSLIEKDSPPNKYSFDQNLGFITACPSNLGSGISIQCKLKLRYLCKDKIELQRIVNKFNLLVTPLFCNHVIL